MIVTWVLAGAGAGAIVGSFLATLVLRWPETRDMSGRSMCDGCGKAIGARDLIPLVSWALLRGRSRCCGTRIDPTHPIVEVLCISVGGVAMAVAPGWVGASGAVFGWLLVAIAALDLRHFWLPDRLTIILALGGIAGGVGGLAPVPADRLIGGVVAYLSLAIIAWGYRAARGREGLGGGDPKLFGAIGLWLGWQSLPFVLLGASGVGLLAVAAMMLRGKAVAATTRLPFGTLLAVAAFPVWLLSR